MIGRDVDTVRWDLTARRRYRLVPAGLRTPAARVYLDSQPVPVDVHAMERARNEARGKDATLAAAKTEARQGRDDARVQERKDHRRRIGLSLGA